MPPKDENPIPRKHRGRTVVLALCLLGAGVFLAASFYPIGHNFSAALPWSHHFSVRSPRARGDLLLAVQSVEVNGAQLHLKPGRFQVKSSGHIIDVQPETDLIIDIHKLVLTIPKPNPAESSSVPNGRVRVEVQSADIKTTGRLMVAVDQFPAVRLNDIRVSATSTDPADVSADVLFARLIASTLADVVNAPVAASEPAKTKFHPECVTITSATVVLRPGAAIHLPVGREMIIGDASQVQIRDLRYDASPAESWKARVDLDIACAPPTEFAVNKLLIKPVTGRLNAALDLTLIKQQWSAALIDTPATPATLTMAGGSIKQQAAGWESELKNATVDITSLQYTSSSHDDHAALSCSAMLTANSQLHWERDGWHGSANLLINKLQLKVSPATPGMQTAPQFVAAADQQITLRDVVLERDVGGGAVRLSLGELSASGSVSNALSLSAAAARFKASGGQFSFKGRDGTLMSADFAGGGSIGSDVTNAGQAGKPGLEIKSKATVVEISTPKNDKLRLQNVDLDLKATLGPSLGLSVACSGEIAVLSDKLAIAGARASITSLELTRSELGKLNGRVAFVLSVPKSEFLDVAQKELAKPIIIPASHVGKILDADLSVSDLHVDAHGLKVAFNGPKLHAEGPIVVSGKLITKRRIVVDVPLAGRIEKHTSSHDDFTLHARLSANAVASFPPAPDLSKQAIADAL